MILNISVLSREWQIQFAAPKDEDIQFELRLREPNESFDINIKHNHTVFLIESNNPHNVVWDAPLGSKEEPYHLVRGMIIVEEFASCGHIPLMYVCTEDLPQNVQELVLE